MSSVVGAININNNKGSWNVGDVMTISPEQMTKTFTGQGHSITGSNVTTHNTNNVTNVKSYK